MPRFPSSLFRSPPRAAMQLTLVVPGLLALADATLAASRPLARFARYATQTQGNDGLAAATLAALDLPGAPAAPLLALGAGFDPGADAVLAADPVTLVAGRDDVQLAARVVDLDAGSANAMVARLDEHFRSDSLAFVTPRADAWFVRVPCRPALMTTATDVVVGRPILPFLPTGADARVWRRWNSEMEMLLHAAPENEVRERAGLTPVNGVWLWGTGTRSDVGTTTRWRIFADAGAAGDLLRGLARHTGGDALPVPRRFDIGLADRAHTAIALAAPGSDDALGAFGDDWIAPAVAALERGTIGTLALVADGRGVVTWVAPRPSPFVRLRAAFGGPPFAAAARE